MALSALKMFAPYSGSAATAPGGRGNGATDRVAVWADGNNITSVAGFQYASGTLSIPGLVSIASTSTDSYGITVSGSTTTSVIRQKFANSDDSIWFSIAADFINAGDEHLSFHAGGTVSPNTLVLHGNGQVMLNELGTVGAPKLCFWTDRNTGLYSAAADTLNISAGGTMAIEAKAAGVAVLGTNTNNNAAAGFIGEYLETTVTSDTDFGTTAEYFDLASRSLTAGDWDVSLIVRVNPNSGSITTPLEIGISTTTGNASTGLSAVNTFRIDTPASTTTTISGVVPVYRMSLAATTTVYAKMFSIYTGSPKYQCRLSARRVR